MSADQDQKLESVQVENVSKEDAAFYSADLAHQGALLQDEEQQLTLWQSAKFHWRPLLICSVSFTGALVYGYDSVVNGASLAMPSFLLHFGEVGPSGLYLPSIWTSLWSAMSSLAQGFGAFGVGFILDRFGRKWSGCVACAVTLVGTVVQYYSFSRGMLLGGKIINGLGIGCAMATGTTYASEISPLRLRGPIQSAIILFFVFTLGVGLGVIRAFVPDIREQAFRNVFAIQWVVGGLATIAFAFAPESPNFLIMRGRLSQARKSMVKIYGAENSIDARFAYLVKSIREEQANRELNTGTLFECFKGTNLRRTMIVIFIYTASLWGGASLLTQSIYFLIIAGLPAVHSFDVSIGGFGLSMVIIILSWIFFDRIQRRVLFQAGCVINFVMMVVIGALYYAPGVGALWGIAVFMNVLIAFQSSLITAVGFSMAGELSSYKLRAKTLAIGFASNTIINWLASFILPYIYNVDAGNLGARTAFIFAATSIGLLAGTYFFVPDTTGLTVPQIDQAFEDKMPTREFRKIPRTANDVTA